MILFYSYHKSPKELYGYFMLEEKIPSFSWKKYHKDINELKRRHKLWASDCWCATMYAVDVLRDRFKLGEPIIYAKGNKTYNRPMYPVECTEVYGNLMSIKYDETENDEYRVIANKFYKRCRSSLINGYFISPKNPDETYNYMDDRFTSYNL